MDETLAGWKPVSMLSQIHCETSSSAKPPTLIQRVALAELTKMRRGAGTLSDVTSES